MYICGCSSIAAAITIIHETDCVQMIKIKHAYISKLETKTEISNCHVLMLIIPSQVDLSCHRISQERSGKVTGSCRKALEVVGIHRKIPDRNTASNLLVFSVASQPFSAVRRSNGKRKYSKRKKSLNETN